MDNLIKTINWSDAQTVKVAESGYYPRMIKLKNGTLLYGINGRCYRSYDEGESWSEGVDYRTNYKITTESGEKALEVDNTAFYEFDDGTVIVGYRAIGYLDDSRKVFCTRLQCSKSCDSGKSWSYHSLICEYKSLQGRFVGSWEPHFGEIDGVLTVFYANDSDNIIAPPFQHLEMLQWIDGKWQDRRIISDGIRHKSRDGMPVWQRLSNGEYVCALEGWTPGTPILEIQLMHSSNGYDWTDPVTVYRAKNGSCGAPYVVELPSGQLLISFQTSEDNFNKNFKMVTILSDGTELSKLDAGHFYPPINVFGTTKDENSMWNGLYITDKYLYACTGTDTAPGGMLLKRIPISELN